MALQAGIGNQAVLEIMRRAQAGEERPDGDVTQRSGVEGEPQTPDRSAVEAGLRAPGRPLDRAVLARKEEQFQADLSGVRMHTGPAAEGSAAAVQARAFTVEQDIVVGKGGGDDKTLDHELTHAVRNQRKASVGHPTGGGFSMTHPHDAEEREAESNASRMRSGGTSTVLGGGTGVQRAAGGQATTAVQRTGPADTTGQPAAEAAGAAQESAPEGKEIIARLSQSIERHTVQATAKRNVFAPGTWWPEQWMAEGPAKLRKTLDRRVLRGEAFNDQDLDDIKQLSQVNPQWLAKVGIGTYEQAESYTKGPFKDWLKLAAGKRVLTATLAVQANHPILRDPEARTPTDPAYTLGRFMHTQAPGISADDRNALEQERDQQIRDTAVDTLYPQGVVADRKHGDALPEKGAPVGKGKKKAPDYEQKDARAREMLTKILLLLRHGLQLYSPEKKGHVADHEQDVVRALAHGGRVNVRIPALSTKDEAAYWLPQFLGITKKADDPENAEDVSERDFATHRTSISANKGGTPGEFKEKGGVAASLTNKLSVGAASPDLYGQDISGGGLGSKDWNGDMVLPNGSYGHVLLVYHRPTMDKDGSLQIGVETIAPHADSPVGYEHDFRSTEATSNPESIWHGHKADKIGSGGLSKNERFIDLRQMSASRPDGDWRAYLEQIKKDWDQALAKTEEVSEERRNLYEELVGPRARS